MSETGARPPPTVVRPGEGRLADLGSIGVANLLTAGSPSLADTAALAQSYGLEFGEPDWLPDVARYGLDPLDGT